MNSFHCIVAACLWLAIGVLPAGCAERSGETMVFTSAPPITENARPADAASTISNAGAYRVSYVTHPAAIPMNETFAVEFWVESAAGAALAERVEMAVDASMPHHHHGMYRVPKVKRIGNGHFQATGMLFHMPGYWEIYFDITHHGITERAQFSVEID